MIIVNYLLNKVNTKSKDLTPYEYWIGHKPDLSNLRVWGCKAHVLIPKPLRDKLKGKTWECKFIGYVQNGSGYRFYNQENGLRESRDAIFLESTNINQITPLEELRLQEDLNNENQDHYKDASESGSKRKSDKLVLDQQTFDPENSGSKRIRQPPIVLKDCHLFNIEENLSEDPTNYGQAMACNDSKQWQDAMIDELESIKKNDVWELTSLPNGRKAIGCKWILRKKFKADSSLDKYKTRLVVKGFTQKPDVDFVDTYSLVAKFASNKINMSVVARMDLELHQLDVKTTFLNGELKEDIFM